MLKRIRSLLSGKSIAMRTEGVTAVIFVHGLAGSAITTWESMIKLFADDRDFKNIAFDCYIYPTSLLSYSLFSPGPGVQELAEGLRTHIRIHHPDKKSISLVAHSLGGLVVRQYLLDILDLPEGQQISGALLYAVPNSGSAWAHINSAISWRHIQAKQLKPSSDLLTSLNKYWVSRKVEEHVAVTYVIGGKDAVVAKSSGAWSQGADLHTIIDQDHRTIVSPPDRNSTSYKILKNFVQKTAVNNELTPKENGPPPLPATNIPESSAICYNVDPLFDIYSARCEEYYVARAVDDIILSASSGANLWVSGASGVGKTAALVRLGEMAHWRVEHLLLGSFQNQNANALVASVCTALYERVGMPEIIVPLSSDTNTLLAHLKKIYHTIPKNTVLAILVEEIPVTPGTDYEKFLEIVYHISMATTENLESGRIIWLFSSINDPDMHIDASLTHFRERMQFVRFEKWDDADMKSLVTKIRKSKIVTISRQNSSKLVKEAEGNPRFLKMVLRRSRNEIGKSVGFGGRFQVSSATLG